jgi:hypothetical protein
LFIGVDNELQLELEEWRGLEGSFGAGQAVRGSVIDVDEELELELEV